ncbi:hypothetical protein POX_g08911 [Penicillium oxalicum]|uniref:hypothetical protein n=1 Tax=Penicillium oxalicum TaxID=69781 RepID=UPI0020B81545|nr:hypothetical protein POX_g08911 [Penicillium oxalicum]KAI2786525.1 hypothetical protein POX_g08911 [Penicillium oxalicum]
MGITLHPYTRNAATRYHGESCKKEADESLTPLNNPSDDWPSLVKVTGLSESEGTTTGQCELRSPERRVILKLYNLRPFNPRITRALQAEVERSLLSNNSTPPTVSWPYLAVDEIVITSTEVENAPMELQFRALIGRPPALNTKGKKWVAFTADDLAECCRFAFQ